MSDRLSIYIFGDYNPNSSDGLLEFNSQNAKLLAEEFDFHFIRFSQDENDGYYKETTEDGFTIHNFGSADVSKLWLPKRFQAWLKAFSQPDAVFHINHIYTYNNFVVARILTKNKVPYLLTPHDTYVYSDEFRRTKPFLKRLYRDILVLLRDHYVLKNASLVHELTDRYTFAIRKITAAPVTVVPNQISDLNLEFRYESLREQVCFIGRFDIFQKGIDKAIAAFGRFKNGANSKDVQFVLAGPEMTGSVTAREQIAEASGLRINQDIFFPGRVNEAHRNRILSESRIYIQLSRFEGFGLSVIQALCASKPVIISSQVPISPIIASYQAGIVADTPAEAADAMSKIFGLEPGAYQQMAANARKCYEAEFSPEVVRPQLSRMYKRAAGRPHS